MILPIRSISEVKISSDSEASPRAQLGTAPYAFTAEKVSGTEQSTIGTTTAADNAVLTVEATSTNAIAAVFRGIAGQVADIFQVLSAAGEELLTLTANGFLGIGTSSPSARLSVTGDTLLDGDLKNTGTSTFNNLIAANATSSNFAITGFLDVSGDSTLAAATTTSLYTNVLGLNNEYFTDLTGTGLSLVGGALTVATSTLNLEPSAIELAQGYLLVGGPAGIAQATSTIFITSDGNVGIGSTNAATALTVAGAITLSSTTPQATTTALYNQANVLYWSGLSVNTAFEQVAAVSADTASTSGSFNVANTAFVHSTSTAAEDTTVRNIRFNNDGTKLFYLGNASTSVYQYDLSTPYDISTTQFSTSTVITQDNNLVDLAFKYFRNQALHSRKSA